MTEQGPNIDGRVLRARAQREERRGQILLAARRVFAVKGYHAASISDIIEAAGIARGTFYLYFEGKRPLFEEIVDGLLADLRQVVRRVDVHSEVPPRVQLYENLHRILEVLLLHQDLAAILLRQAVGLDDEFDQKMAQFYGQLLEIVRSSLKVGMELGLVRPLNPEVVACCILGSVKEVLGTALLSPGWRLPEVAAMVNEILAFNLEGVLAAS